jgi:hypothetical protein
VYGKLNVLNDGFSEGYYKSTVGFASSDQKLHDNFYYQRYSYEIQSTLPLEKYAETLKQLVHVAGTKMFGKVVSASNADISSTTSTSSREDVLTITRMSNNFVVGANVAQSVGNTIIATGVVSEPVVSTIVLASNTTGIVTSYVGVYQPTAASPTSTGNVVSVVANTTSNTTTLYLHNVSGNVFNSTSNVEIHTGWNLVIDHVANGNTVTGSFAVGETVSGPNNQTGIVTVANSTNVRLANISSNWTTSGFRLTGATSNASANVASWTYYYQNYDVVSAINTLTVSNTDGYFTTGTITGNATANVAYVEIKIAQ